MKKQVSVLVVFALCCLFSFAQSDNKRVEYHDNGKLKSSGHVSGGNKVGMWTFYFENGEKQAEGLFRDGMKTGVWNNWYSTGQIKTVGGFLIHNGESLKDGKWTWYHKNGVISEQGSYDKGKKKGVWQEWDKLEIPSSKKVY